MVRRSRKKHSTRLENVYLKIFQPEMIQMIARSRALPLSVSFILIMLQPKVHFSFTNTQRALCKFKQKKWSEWERKQRNGNEENGRISSNFSIFLSELLGNIITSIGQQFAPIHKKIVFKFHLTWLESICGLELVHLSSISFLQKNLEMNEKLCNVKKKYLHFKIY